MAAVASLVAAAGSALDRYEAPSSSSSSSSSTSSSSSSGDTTEEEENSSSSSSTSSSSSSSSWSTSSSEPKSKKKKKNQHGGGSGGGQKKKQKNKSKSIRKGKSKSSVCRIGDANENGDEVSSMLLLGAELLKEVEEAASAAAAAAAQVESVPSEALLPISHYVVHGGADRSTLLEHVMSSVPAAQWQAILPPVLKEMNGGELKQLCLQQLQLLSDSTILNIINGDGDQGPSGKAVSSTTIVGKERSGGSSSKKKKSKKSKKSKKKGKKTKKSDRLAEETEKGQQQRGGGGEDEEESSGKTLMELLELEMRARAIKALLKKEEEGEEEEEEEEEDDGDECWSDALIPPAVAQDGAAQRPFKATESDYSDKHKQQAVGHGHHQHRPADLPSVSSKVSVVNQQPSGPYRPLSLLAGDGQQGIRRHSSSFRDDDRNDEMVFRRSQQQHHHQPRHYRHHHHHRRSSDHDHDRSRSAPRRAPVKTEAITSPDEERKPSPFLSPSPPVVEKAAIPVPVEPAAAAAEVSNKPEKMEVEEEKVEEAVAMMKDVVEDEEIEYEEDGIQEVDIELGSGSGSSSEDDAHSARI